MSSPDPSDDNDLACASMLRRNARLGTAVVVLAIALTACGPSAFRPLHAPSAVGTQVSEQMKRVDFAPIPGRVGQRIRNDLIFESTGGGSPLPPKYRFEVVLKENVTSTLVNIRGDVSGAVYTVAASFRLIDSEAQKVVFQGTSHARAPFERFDSIYSNVRAREDAENRVARTIAQDLKSRLATYLSRAV